MPALAACLLMALSGCAGVQFRSYEGRQENWPTAPGSLVDNRYALPTYYGFPSRPYTVLGMVESSTRRINRYAILSYAANRAKALGADAIIAVPRSADSDAPNPFAQTLDPLLRPSTDRGFFSAKASVLAIKWRQETPLRPSGR